MRKLKDQKVHAVLHAVTLGKHIRVMLKLPLGCWNLQPSAHHFGRQGRPQAQQDTPTTLRALRYLTHWSQRTGGDSRCRMPAIEDDTDLSLGHHHDLALTV